VIKTPFKHLLETMGKDKLSFFSKPHDRNVPDSCKIADRPYAHAIQTTIELMRRYGLVGWKVKLDHARRRAGQCDYNKQVISLSRLYIRNTEKSHILDTILHEIAHALVGPHHGHNAVWRKKAREIGCTATRCHTLNFSSARWQMTCPNGCFSVERHRRKAGLVCAKCKATVIFLPNSGTL